jgi:hypothetical protein
VVPSPAVGRQRIDDRPLGDVLLQEHVD